jgi:hypothetical protein
MAKTTVTNVSTGARGIRDDKHRLIMLERGESAEVELTDAERKDAKATGYFEFGKAAAERAAEGEGEAPAT